MKALRWTLRPLLVLALAAAAAWSIVGAAGPPAAVRRPGPHGEIVLRRLGPARWAVQAAFPLDQAFAEGFLDGMDAAPLLEARRQAVAGRLEAIGGPEARPADAWARAMDLPGRAARAWEGLDAAARAWLQAYADGVNAAWREGIPPIRRGLPGRPPPAPWRPQDSLAVAMGLALAHPGWLEATLADRARALPEPLRAALEISPAVGTPPADFSERWQALWIWAAFGVAPEPGWFRGCQEAGAFRFHAMAAPVFPLPWREIQDGERLRVRWPGLPGALAEIGPEGGRWLAPAPASDPLDQVGDLVRLLMEEGNTAHPGWRWRSLADLPPCRPAAPRRTALLSLPPEGWLERRVHGMLRRWDGRFAADSPSALVYAAWRWEVLRMALEGPLGKEGLALLALRRSPEAILEALLVEGEVSEEIRRGAYRRALEAIGRRYGDLHTIWEWGKAHAASFRLLGWGISGDLPVGGDADDLWPTPMDPARPYRTAFWPAITVEGGSGLRQRTAPAPPGWRWP